MLQKKTAIAAAYDRMAEGDEGTMIQYSSSIDINSTYDDTRYIISIVYKGEM